jgi:GNAT superfamily N-acetyltransferase
VDQTVRPARISDAGDIARLTVELGYDADTASIARRLSRLLSRPDQQFFVAESDGRVVGWVHVLISEYVELDPFVAIGGLVVDRTCRRKGIGRLLMQHAEQWASENGCSIVRLWSTISRTGAHEFYQEVGYAKVKTQHSFVKSLDGSGSDSLRKFVPRVDE